MMDADRHLAARPEQRVEPVDQGEVVEGGVDLGRRQDLHERDRAQPAFRAPAPRGRSAARGHAGRAAPGRWVARAAPPRGRRAGGRPRDPAGPPHRQPRVPDGDDAGRPTSPCRAGEDAQHQHGHDQQIDRQDDDVGQRPQRQLDGLRLLTATRTPIRMKSRNRARERIFMRPGECHTPPRARGGRSGRCIFLVVVRGLGRSRPAAARLPCSAGRAGPCRS